MKSLSFVISGMLLLSSLSFAETTEISSTSKFANILQGDVLTSARITLNEVLNKRASGADSSFHLGVSAQYFVIDRLAVGAGFSLDVETGLDTMFALGPAVTYYYWQQDRLAAYVSGSANFGLSDILPQAVLQGNLGLDFFITPSVAFGPSIGYRHVLRRNNASDISRLLIDASFTIAL